MANLAEVLAAAQTMLRDEGLSTWTIRWSNSTRTAGQCVYGKQTIKLSRTLMEVWTMEACLHTIAHETAHALTRGHHHDTTWRRECIRLGGTGQRCWNDDNGRPELPIRGLCPAGHKFMMTRMPTATKSCNHCSRRFSYAHLITWGPNPDYKGNQSAAPRPTSPLRQVPMPAAAQTSAPTPSTPSGKAPRCHAPMPGGKICKRVQGHTRGHDAR